jgi:Protein of unknown function (DUF3551)
MRLWLAVAIAGIFAASTPPAQAAAWCGFLDKEHSQVRCGFSSLAQCKQAIGASKEAVCMPDPEFAATMRRKNARS